MNGYNSSSFFNIFLIDSISIKKVLGSTSTNIGFKPNKTTTSAVETNVKEGTITSSPDFKSKLKRAIFRASVPFAQEMQCLTFKNFDNSFSKLLPPGR